MFSEFFSKYYRPACAEHVGIKKFKKEPLYKKLAQ
jgi:hypothetical protein